MNDFDLQPFKGVGRLSFGMHRDDVLAVMGRPRPFRADCDKWGAIGEVTVGYDEKGRIDHFGFGKGDLWISFRGRKLWTPKFWEDPNGVFLEHDPDPIECLGFLMFLQLGIQTTGYLDDNESQYSISMFIEPEHDILKEYAETPDLSKYRR